MRLMVIYYTSSSHMKIADIIMPDDFDLTRQTIPPAKVAPDCEAINGVVQVIKGVDYDKSEYEDSVTSLEPGYPVMAFED